MICEKLTDLHKQQAARVGLAARHQLTGKGLLPLGIPGRLAPLRRHRLRPGGHRRVRSGVPQLHHDGRRAEAVPAARPHLPAGTESKIVIYLIFPRFFTLRSANLYQIG